MSRIGAAFPSANGKRGSNRKRPVKGGAIHVQKRGHILAALTFFDQLPGVTYLLLQQFPLAFEFHAPAGPCGVPARPMVKK